VDRFIPKSEGQPSRKDVDEEDVPF
jgi:hypothetical protein